MLNLYRFSTNSDLYFPITSSTWKNKLHSYFNLFFKNLSFPEFFSATFTTIYMHLTAELSIHWIHWISKWMNEWLWINAKSAIFQPYCDESVNEEFYHLLLTILDTVLQTTWNSVHDKLHILHNYDSPIIFEKCFHAWLGPKMTAYR